MIRRSSTNLSRLMSELITFLCLKLSLLNFAIAHGQKRLLCLSEFVIIHKKTRSVGSGWQWISEGLNYVRFLFKFVT